MYDLVYANFNNPNFNLHEQYAYFRKFEDDILLFVLNFHDRELYTEVKIPFEAFQYLNLKEGDRYSCIDLLTGMNEADTLLSVDQPFKTSLPPWKGKIIKLTKKNGSAIDSAVL
jgi:hypothetical protein